jgi:hypothetical protein
MTWVTVMKVISAFGGAEDDLEAGECGGTAIKVSDRRSEESIEHQRHLPAISDQQEDGL